jgi:hypothetical protein
MYPETGVSGNLARSVGIARISYSKTMNFDSLPSPTSRRKSRRTSSASSVPSDGTLKPGYMPPSPLMSPSYSLNPSS